MTNQDELLSYARKHLATHRRLAGLDRIDTQVDCISEEGETIQQLIFRGMYDVCQELDLGVNAYFRICKAAEKTVESICQSYCSTKGDELEKTLDTTADAVGAEE